MTTPHPLDLLRGEEVIRARDLLRVAGHVDDHARFVHVVLDEPEKTVVAASPAGRSGRPRGACPRRARTGPRPARGGRVRHGQHGARGPRPSRACAPRCCSASRSPRSSRCPSIPTGSPRCSGGASTDMATASRSTRGRPATSAWTSRRVGASRAASPSCATRRPTTATPADRGARRLLRHGRRRGHRGPRPRRRCRYRPSGAATCPPTSARCAPTCGPLEITQPDGPSFEVDGNAVRWQRWSFRVGVRPVRGSRPAHRRLRRGGRTRPVLLPGVDLARWSCPTATRARCTAGRTPSTPASGASGGWRTRSRSGCDCLGVIHYFDAVLATEQGEPYTVEQRDLHARGGLRDPLEAP